MSFAKTVTLDGKSIDFIEFLMKELSISNFSQALRISVTYAKIYKIGTADREEQLKKQSILEYQIDEKEAIIQKANVIFKEIQVVLLSRWSDKQKVAKLKEIL